MKINKQLIEGIGVRAFKMTSLFSNAPAQGEIGKLSEKGSSVTLDCNFEDYDMLFILFATRIWGWLHKWEIVPVRYLDSSSIQVGNLFGVSVPCYNTGEVAMMQYYITNNNTITVHYNSHTTGDNHLYIKEIVGVKFKN